jgi:hypothetical protein
MTKRHYALLGIMSMLVISCGAVPSKPTLRSTAITWNTGSARFLPKDQVQPLGGSLSGSTIVVSNNPEKITSPGLLFSTGSSAQRRSGTATAVKKGVLYLFHINTSGQDTQLRVLVTNPGRQAVTLKYKGALYNSQQTPLTTGVASGPSYAVANDWAKGNLSINGTVKLEASKATQIASIDFPSSTVNGRVRSTMLDGRLEFEASDGVYIYVMATPAGSGLREAVTMALNGSFATGELKPESRNAYGRSAGIYRFAEWLGTTKLELPATPSFLGLAWNTSAKFGGQNQAPAGVMVLNQSSLSHYGGYGMRYAVDLQFSTSAARQVRLHLGQSFGKVRPSFIYGGPVRLTLDGKSTLVSVYLTPDKQTQPISNWFTVPKGTKTISFESYIPGLISGEGQILVESK